MSASSSALFAWGWTGFGQCGCGVPGVGEEQALLEPHRVPSFTPNSGIASVVAGNFHAAALTCDGSLFTWGNGRHGELGHPATPRKGGHNFLQTLSSAPDNEEEPLPRLVRFKRPSVRVSHVACGMFHTLAATREGHLYAFGDNASGQLGLGKFGPPAVAEPTLVPETAGRSGGHLHVSCVAAGDEFSAAASVEGRLFTWGGGVRGRESFATSSPFSSSSFVVVVVVVIVVVFVCSPPTSCIQVPSFHLTQHSLLHHVPFWLAGWMDG